MSNVTKLLVSCVVVCVVCRLTSAVLLDEQQWIHVSRCRAKCLSESMKPPVTDSKCMDDDDCFLCWQLCERQTVDAWNSLCTPSSDTICPTGCRVACSFVNSAVEGRYSTSGSWEFPRKPVVKVISEAQLVIGWNPVNVIGSSADQSDTVVYSLFWQDQSHHDWGHVCTTSSRSAYVNGPHETFRSLTFKLVAVTETGVLAQTYPPYPPDDDYAYDFDVFDSEVYEYYYYYEEDDDVMSPLSLHDDVIEIPDDNQHKPETVATQSVTKPTTTKKPVVTEPLNLHIKAHFVPIDNQMRFNITWRKPEQHVTKFNVHWRRLGCDKTTNGTSVDCGLPPQNKVAIVNSTERQIQHILLSDVTYNSRYLIRIMSSAGSSPRRIVLTPRCHVTNDNMTTCLQLAEVNRRSWTVHVASGVLPTTKATYKGFVILAVCGALLVSIVVIIVVISRRNENLQRALKERMDSLRKRSSSFRESLRRSLRRNSGRSSTSQEALAKKRSKKDHNNDPAMTSSTPFLTSEVGENNNFVYSAFESPKGLTSHQLFATLSTPDGAPSVLCDVSDGTRIPMMSSTPVSDAHKKVSSNYTLTYCSDHD